MDALLLLYPKGKNKGDYNLNSSKRLISNKNPKYIFTGIQIIKSKVFLEMKKKVFPLSNIYKELLKKERISGIVYKGKWTHIGTLDSLKKQKKMLK